MDRSYDVLQAAFLTLVRYCYGTVRLLYGVYLHYKILRCTTPYHIRRNLQFTPYNYSPECWQGRRNLFFIPSRKIILWYNCDSVKVCLPHGNFFSLLEKNKRKYNKTRFTTKKKRNILYIIAMYLLILSSQFTCHQLATTDLAQALFSHFNDDAQQHHTVTLASSKTIIIVAFLVYKCYSTSTNAHQCTWSKVNCQCYST